VDLGNALACPDVRTAFNRYRASEVFGAHGGTPNGAPVKTGKLPESHAPGVPTWPVPPMQA
jgi:hypothetical protein